MSGSTLTGSFGAAGVGSVIYIPAGETLTYALTAAGDDAFIGTVKLQTSKNGGQSWEPVNTWTGTEETPLTADAVSGIARSAGAQFRFNCSAFDEASDAIAWTLSDTEETLHTARLVDGVIQNRRSGLNVFEAMEDGIRTPRLYSDAVQLTDAGGVYFGAPDTEGCWRIVRSTDDLVLQRLEDVEGTLTWVTKLTVAAAGEG